VDNIKQFLHLAGNICNRNKAIAIKAAILNLPPSEVEIQQFWEKSESVSLFLFSDTGTMKKNKDGFLFKKNTPLRSSLPGKKSETRIARQGTLESQGKIS
jgi:hypothetical protein